MKILEKIKKIRLFGGIALLLFGILPGAVQAGGFYLNNYGRSYYPYPGSVVVVQPTPLVIPRVGSNDYLYEYDNVYGLGASAAGRMDRVVVNPPPQLYIVPPYRGF